MCGFFKEKKTNWTTLSERDSHRGIYKKKKGKLRSDPQTIIGPTEKEKKKEGMLRTTPLTSIVPSNNQKKKGDAKNDPADIYRPIEEGKQKRGKARKARGNMYVQIKERKKKGRRKVQHDEHATSIKNKENNTIETNT